MHDLRARQRRSLGSDGVGDSGSAPPRRTPDPLHAPKDTQDAVGRSVELGASIVVSSGFAAEPPEEYFDAIRALDELCHG